MIEKSKGSFKTSLVRESVCHRVLLAVISVLRAFALLEIFPELRPHLEAAWDQVDGVRHNPLTLGPDKPADSARADHPKGWFEAVAQTVPKPPGDPGDRTGCGIPVACGVRVDGQLDHGGGETLSPSHGRRLRAGDLRCREGGAESGAAGARNEPQSSEGGNEKTPVFLVPPEGLEPSTL